MNGLCSSANLPKKVSVKMSNELLCKDCKHSFRQFRELNLWGTGHEWRCRKTYVPETIEHDPVLGPQKQAGYYRHCRFVRLHEHDYRKECGKEALYWEPKNKKFLFLEIKHSQR